MAAADVEGVLQEPLIRKICKIKFVEESNEQRRNLSVSDGQGILYGVTEHKAVFNMAELDSIKLPYPEWDAKNLFVRDDKKRNYYLITVKGDKRVDLKEFRKQHSLRALSFASADDLFAIMGLLPGSVTPLGILNDEELQVHFFLDSEFIGNKIGVHPNDNTATVWMQADDLMELIQKHGNEANFTDIQ